MSLSARRELVKSLARRYRASRRDGKQRILDEFTSTTGYHRKYAIALLKQAVSQPKTPPPVKIRTRAGVYTAAAREALITVWSSANRVCSKRLAPFLPDMVAVLERHGHLALSAETRTQLLAISPATVDRLLRPLRRGKRRRGFSTTRAGAFLKRQIPIRTFADWDDLQPGFIEADLVAHCGTTTQGTYLNTLVLTDVASGWTECFALLCKSQDWVLEALAQARCLLPFSLLGLDTDNGSEFLNKGVLRHCRDEQITFMRCRPYKKNDQCHVEQKNGLVVRRVVGYDRCEGTAACRHLAELYGVLRLYVNFFRPSVKLLAKERDGSKVRKQYDRAQTPCQRLLCASTIADEVKTALREQYAQLDPVALLRRMEYLQDLLWQYAHRPAGWKAAEPTERQPFALNEETSSRDARLYRQTRKPRRPCSVPHTWRTRPDPFADVWEQLQAELAENPDQQANDLFQNLQRRYPEKYRDGQLRTLQRRVRAWRATQDKGKVFRTVIIPLTASRLDDDEKVRENDEPGLSSALSIIVSGVTHVPLSGMGKITAADAVSSSAAESTGRIELVHFSH